MSAVHRTVRVAGFEYDVKDNQTKPDVQPSQRPVELDDEPVSCSCCLYDVICRIGSFVK